MRKTNETKLMLIKLKPEYKNKNKLLGRKNWYLAVQDSVEKYRVIDDGDMPSMFPKEYFEEPDVTQKLNWLSIKYDDGKIGYAPSEFSEKGFFEKFYEGDEDINGIFWEVVYTIQNELLNSLKNVEDVFSSTVFGKMSLKMCSKPHTIGGHSSLLEEEPSDEIRFNMHGR